MITMMTSLLSMNEADLSKGQSPPESNGKKHGSENHDNGLDQFVSKKNTDVRKDFVEK